MTEKILSVAAIAEMVNGQVEGDEKVLIRGFAPIDAAGAGDISFLAKAAKDDLLATTEASAVIVPQGVAPRDGLPLIQVRDPYLVQSRHWPR